LGGIESLLSAKVADAMSARKHRSNMELVAQGAANVASAMFGGISVTGTIARTATNVRAGARSPVAGMLHAAAPLALPRHSGPVGQLRTTLRPGAGAVLWCLDHGREGGIVRLLRDWRTAAVLVTTLASSWAKDLTFRHRSQAAP
jgi:SulP family sulfate permease